VEDEQALIASAQAGQQAMGRLLEQHQDRIYAVCRRITGNDADARDATQDALIAVMRGLPRFDGRSKFSTWAYRVATNACLDELRRRKRRPVVGLPEFETADRQPVGPGGRSRAAGSIAGRVADRLDVDAALRELSPDFRAAVVLRDLCTFDYAEIAEVLGIPPGTVRSRISRARALLADQLRDPAEGPDRRSQDHG